MPVFDFKNATVETTEPECTYKIFYSDASETSAEHPILIPEVSSTSMPLITHMMCSTGAI